MNRRQHWDKIYSTWRSDELSWYQARPETSLRLIASIGIGKDARIIDAGGGDSLLVDSLLDQGFRDVTVIDVSSPALQRARERLGERARRVNWICGDVLEFRPAVKFDVWHDRAVFHFLTDREDRAGYVQAVLEAVKPGGQVIIATFGLEGPPKCSGLDVVRYSPESLADTLGDRLKLVESLPQLHTTPKGTAQHFNYSRFVVVARSGSQSTPPGRMRC